MPVHHSCTPIVTVTATGQSSTSWCEEIATVNKQNKLMAINYHS
uniref:Uncharacterized protein n=1 Tax=Arundo donax TaxID=35708 RepID=A0A0A9TIE8_ARUDO